MCRAKDHPLGPHRCAGASNQSRRARTAANKLYRDRLADAFSAGGHDDVAERVRGASFSSMALLTEAAGLHPTDVVGLDGRVPGRTANRRVSDDDAALIADVGAATGTGATFNAETNELDSPGAPAPTAESMLAGVAMRSHLDQARETPARLPRDPDPVQTHWDPAELPESVADARGGEILDGAAGVGPGEPGCDDHAREVTADADAFLRHAGTSRATDALVDAPCRATRDHLWDKAGALESAMRDPVEGEAAAGMAYTAELAERDYIAALESDLGDTSLMARQPRRAHGRVAEVYGDMPLGAPVDPAFQEAVSSMDDKELAEACARYTLGTSRMYGVAHTLAEEHDTLYTDAVGQRAERTGTYATALQREVRHRIAQGNEDTDTTLAHALAQAADEYEKDTAPGTADAVRQLRYYAANARHGRRRAPTLAPQAMEFTAAEAAVAGLSGRHADTLAEYTHTNAPKTPTRGHVGARRTDPHFEAEVRARERT